MRAASTLHTRSSASTSATIRLARTAFAAPSSLRQRRSLHPSPPSAFLSGLKSLLGLEKSDGSMGNSSSRKGWAPTPDNAPRQVSRSGFDITPLTAAQRQAAAEQLPSMAKYVALEHGTERAFTGKTVNGYSHDHKGKGVYTSALGGLPLFSSDTKFNSGTGWPSFYAPVDPSHIIEVTDMSIPFMPRVEVLDRRSGAHLGHVFDDGPAPTGKRYCINAAALAFIPEGEQPPPESRPVQ